MIEDARLPPFEALRNELTKLRDSVLIKATRHAPTLELLDAYLCATDMRLAILESRVATLRKSLED